MRLTPNPRSVICDATKPLPSDRKSTRLNSSHTVIYTLSLHDALPIFGPVVAELVIDLTAIGDAADTEPAIGDLRCNEATAIRSEEHTSELQSHRDLHSFPTRRSSDLWTRRRRTRDRPHRDR